MSDQRITGRKTVWEHKSRKFRIDELTVESDGHTPIQWCSFERGEAVAALIVNLDTNHVILVRQFRPPIASTEGADYMLVETVAGMVRQNEEVLQCLRREVAEETGYDLKFDAKNDELEGAEFICEFYPSPGGSSEKIYLFYVEIDSYTPKEAGGGVLDEGEFIEPVVIPIDVFFEQIHRGEFKDPKLIIAGLWLEKRWADRGKRKDRQVDKQEFAIVGATTPAGADRFLGYYFGDIAKVKDVDVWVNTTNTQFFLDSIHDETLSARIRFLGAERVDNIIVDDKIQRAVDHRLSMGKGMRIAQVLDTDPGMLRETHNVQRLLHIASTEWDIRDDRFQLRFQDIDKRVECITRALEKCDRLNAERWRGAYRSILLPILGTGLDSERSGEFADVQPGKKWKSSQYLSIQNLCGTLIPHVIRYFEEHPQSKIERVYFLAYNWLEREITDSFMTRNAALKRLRAQAATPSSTAD